MNRTLFWMAWFAGSAAIASLLFLILTPGCAAPPSPREETREVAAAVRGAKNAAKKADGGTSCPVAGSATVASGASVVVANDTLLGATTTFAGSCCASSNAEEKIYAVTAGAAGRLRLDLAYPASMNLGLYVRTVCTDPATELACSESAPAGGTETVVIDVAAGELVYAFADGVESSPGSGSFTLTATLLPPAVNVTASPTCAPPVAIGQDGKIVISGTTSGADDTIPMALGSCGTAMDATSGADATVAFTPSVAGTIHVSASAPAGSFWDGVLYLETTCGDVSTASICVNDTSSGTEAFHAPVAAGVTYTLVLDSVSALYNGALQGTITLSIP